MADSLRGGGAATSCCVRSSAAGMRYSMCEPSVLSDLYRSRPSTCSSSSQACGVAFAMKHRKLNRVGGHWKWEVSPRRMGSKNFFVFSFDSILFRQKQTPAAAARHSFDDGAWTSLSYQQANQIQAQEDFREFLSGPPPGDLAHIEGFCRIYRIAEDLHCTVMDLIRNSSSTAVSAQTRASGDQQEGMSNISNPEDGDVSVREEAVVAGLARMAAVLQSGRQQLFESRVDANSAGQGHFDYTSGNKSISQFRMEMTSCCDHFQAALESLMPSNLDRNEVVYRCLERLRNVCLDTGFPRPEGAAAHADIPNLAAVKFRPDRPGRGVDNSEPIVFWIGGQMTEKGLEWLMMKGFKLLVDLRVEGEKSGPRLEAALYRANTSGRMRLVNMPVPIGTAPSMGQVKKFARLVADSDNTPLFLFSRAGFGRTCSMVTRWRESVLRGGVELGGEGDVRRDSPQPNTVDKGIVLLNGVFLEARSEGGDTIDSPRSENTITPIECSVATSVSQGQLGSTAERGLLPSVALNDISGVPVVTLPGNGNPAKDVIEQYEGVEVLFRMKNAFEAQRPGPDVFSRQGMTLYKKRAKVRPLGTSTPLLKDPASSAKSHHVPSKADDIAGPAGTWGLSTRGIPRAPPASDRTSSSFELEACTSEGIHGESSISATTVMNSKEQGYPNQAASNGALVKIAGNDKVPDESSDDASPVQGDMCASTTGVVRLQSRKKAEMYLVRTDGFSCTREKVKESTLAFTHPSTQQQMLMWKTSPKTVLLLKKLGNELMEEAQQVAAFLYHQERMNVMVEPEVHDRFARFPGFGFVQTFYNQDSGELHEMVDFVVCLGGDGVILHASNLFRSAVPPVVSFNLGSLGFLTTHPFQNFKQDLRAIIHGNTGMEGVYITLRMRLRCELFRNGKLVPGKVFDVLNEVVVDRGSNPYLCKIECFERNRLITKVQADGVLVATPTGSTAYSTAAGGSMVHPNVPCMLFTPICPHSLSFRPVILPDSALLELKVPLDARNNAWVSFDGKRRQQLCKGDSVRIAMSEHPLPTVNKSDQTDDWFSSLVRCLNWNERLEQKAFVS